jgi:hypothetical protein
MSDATEHAEFDFGDHLPAGVDSFALHWIAGRFGGTVRHWFNLAEKGVFGTGIVDLRSPGSSKAMLRIPRASLVKFLNSRRDITEVAEANPQPAPRAPRKKKAKKKIAGKNGAAK